MMPNADGRDLESEIIAILGRGARKARFVTEVASQLARSQPASSAGLEHALDRLESSGRALVREQYCGDPHLAEADLRIVALIQPHHPESSAGSGSGADDPLAVAVADIEAVWGRWLGEYLANHRCG